MDALSGQILSLRYYNSTRNVLRIEFQSDLTTVNTGFRAVYEVLKGEIILYGASCNKQLCV